MIAMDSDLALVENVVVYTGQIQASPHGAYDWKLFPGGEHLNDLVANHNRRCKQKLHQALTGLIEEQAEEITHSLNILPLQQHSALPNPQQLWQTKIMIIDLATVQKFPDLLVSLVDRIADRPHVLHLIQITNENNLPAQSDLFQSIRYLALTTPPVFNSQAQLEAFFEQLLFTYLKAWEGAAQNPYDKSHYIVGNGEPYIRPYRRQFVQSQSGTGKAIRFMYRDYRTQLPDLVADVRDVAMMRRLSPDQTVNLGRAAAIQEFTLIHIIKKMDPDTKYWVSVDPIRLSMFKIPVDTPLKLDQIQNTGLLEVSLTDSGLDRLRPENDTLRKLGFVEKVTRVVCFDRPDVCEQLESLEGKVKIRQFNAELPKWLEPPPPVGFSMTETALGLNIEE